MQEKESLMQINYKIESDPKYIVNMAYKSKAGALPGKP